MLRSSAVYYTVFGDNIHRDEAKRSRDELSREVEMSALDGVKLRLEKKLLKKGM